MDIQQIFYFAATIAMSLSIIVLVSMLVLLFYIKKKISDLDKYSRNLVHNIESIVEETKRKVNTVTNFPTSLLGKFSKKSF